MKDICLLYIREKEITNILFFSNRSSQYYHIYYHIYYRLHETVLILYVTVSIFYFMFYVLKLKQGCEDSETNVVS